VGRQPGVLGMQLAGLDAAVLVQRHHPARPGDGQLVRPVAAVNQPGPLAAEGAQGLGHGLQEIGREGAGQLAAHTRRVGERAEDVEDGAGAELAPHGHNMGDGRVVHGRHHEADTGLGQRALDHLGAHAHLHAHLPQRIGGAAQRGEVAVAVLGHRHARARHDEGRGGGDVERALAVAAGADDVHRPLRRTDRDAARTHRGGGGGVFVHRFPPRAERHEEPADLARRGRALEEDAERLLRLRGGQRAVRCGGDDGLERLAHGRHRAGADGKASLGARGNDRGTFRLSRVRL